MSRNHNFISTTQHETDDDTSERLVSESTRRAAGQRVLFRVMNLQGHSGVRDRAEDGAVTYVVDNQQYPDQGDFAFGDEETGFQDAITRAFPRGLHNVHAVQVDAKLVVEPYPEDAPGMVYIKNGATATAKPVPRDKIDQYLDHPDAVPSDISRQIAAELFPPDDKTAA